jgi:hypothetical protein
MDYWYFLYALQHRPLSAWTILNIVQGSKYSVGLITQQTFSLSSSLVFPRGFAVPPSNDPFPLSLGLNNYLADSSANPQRVYSFALEGFPLPTRRFFISVVKLPICGTFDKVTGYLDCYIAAKEAKVSMLLSSDRTATLAYQLEFMRQTALQIPVINTSFITNKFSSSVLYPFFTRLTQTGEYYGSITVLFYKFLRYSKANLFADSRLGKEGIDDLVLPIKAGGIDYQNIDQLIGFDDLKSAAQTVKNTTLRPLSMLMLADMSLKFLEELYTAGVRAKDVVLFGTVVRMTNIDQLATTPEQVQVLDEFRPSYLSAEQSLYVGNIGQAFKAKVEKEFGSSETQDCLNYDSVQQAILALEFALRRGLDFYDSKAMSFAIRSVRFTGCSGAVQQATEHNNRKDAMLTFSQFRKEEGDSTVVPIITVSISGSRTYYLLDDFEWYDGSSDIPMVERLNYKDCPFPEEYREDSPEGKQRAMTVDFAIAGFAVEISLSTFFLHFRKLEFDPSKEPILLSTQDRLILLSVLADAVCIYLINPSLYSLVEEAGVIDKFKLIDFNDGRYYSYLYLVYSVISFGCLIVLLVVLNQYRPYYPDIQLIGVLFLHTLSFVLLFALTSTFDCSEADSGGGDAGLTEAFMDLDCYASCWTGKHLVFAILSMIAAGIYVAVSSLLCASLINTLDGFQFEIRPSYLLVRLPVLATLIAIFKSDLSLNTSVSLYLLILGMFVMFCFKTNVLGLPLLSLLLNAVYLLVLLLSLSHTIALNSHSADWVHYLLISISVLLVLGVSGLIYRKLPKCLISPPKIDTVPLFAFAFRRNQAPIKREELYLQVKK